MHIIVNIVNKATRRQLYKDNKDNLLDTHHIATLVACAISKKYSKMRGGPAGLTTTYIKRLISKVPEKPPEGKHLIAEHLIKSYLQYRHSHKNDYIKRFINLHTSVLALLVKATETTSESQIYDVDQAYIHPPQSLSSQNLHTLLQLLTKMENCLQINFHLTLLMLQKLVPLSGNVHPLCTLFLLNQM